MEIVSDFIFGGSKITGDDDCSHEIKRHVPIKKQRHYFANKGLFIKAVVFPVVIYGY